MMADEIVGATDVTNNKQLCKASKIDLLNDYCKISLLYLKAQLPYIEYLQFS